MEKIILIILFTLLSFQLFPRNNIKSNQIDEYLEKLDRQIEQKNEFDIKKLERINLLHERLKPQRLTLDEKYALTALLFDEYSTYKNDSMYVYARKLIGLAGEMNNKDKMVIARIAFTNSHLWAGLFKDAYEYASSIDTTGTSKETRIEYLMMLFSIEFECGLYAKYERYFDEIYKNKIASLITSLEELLPQGDDRLLEIKQKELFLAGRLDEAYNIALERFNYKDETRQQTASKLGNAGYTALDKGDTITAIKYMVDASILEIELGSRQTPALRMLAQAIYPQGYLNKSYKYIQLAMNNARFFGSRYRIYEASIMLPTIDRDLYETTKKQKNELTFAVILITLFFLALLISIFTILKQNKKLVRSKILIDRQNQSLLQINDKMKRVNDELIEANNIKETYLGQTLADNSSYITKIDELTKTISRKLKSRQYDDITLFISKNLYGKERERMLQSFDKMFLKLYPDFIVRFNTLLNEKDYIRPEDENTLTPELRIFALIRLGITKNETIAEILDYSVSTVKNYKTKIRNISVVPNEEFDKKLMDIESSIGTNE